MEYIVHTRARFRSMQGDVNIPYRTVLEEHGGFIFWKGKPLCAVASKNSHDFFSPNEDGNGLKRGVLVTAIRKALEKRDKNHQARWDKVWGDAIAAKYKRKDHEDFWLWNHDFYEASIEDLRHIAAIIDIKN